MTSVKHTIELKERSQKEHRKELDFVLWGICKMNGKPDLEDTKPGHALGRRSAAQRANGSGSAGSLGCEELGLLCEPSSILQGLSWHLPENQRELGVKISGNSL